MAKIKYGTNERQKKYFLEKVKPIEVKKKSLSQLLSEMTNTGFQGRKLGEIVDVWDDMTKDKNVTIVMGYAASLSTTGQWKIIKWLIENRFIDILVSTGANVSEDIVDGMGYPYWKGDHRVNDAALLEADINRYYDVFGSDMEYMEMIDLIGEFFTTLDSKYKYSTREFLYLFGRWLDKKKIDSIVTTAAKNKVPVFCPAIVDSAYGDGALIAKRKGIDITIDSVKDYAEFMKLGEKMKDVGVIYIGGGVPKDFIQLLAVSSILMYDDKKQGQRAGGMFRPTTKEYFYPHKYAIQITTDAPHWGGLSGCTFEEATSWGKERAGGKNVACYADATIALPIVTHALNERISKRPAPPDFSWFFKDLDK